MNRLKWNWVWLWILYYFKHVKWLYSQAKDHCWILLEHFFLQLQVKVRAISQYSAQGPKLIIESSRAYLWQVVSVNFVHNMMIILPTLKYSSKMPEIYQKVYFSQAFRMFSIIYSLDYENTGHNLSTNNHKEQHVSVCQTATHAVQYTLPRSICCPSVLLIVQVLLNIGNLKYSAFLEIK